MIDRILIVGLGSIGKRHLALARNKFPRADIRTLRHQANNELLPESNGCFTSLDDAITFSPQLTVIANPAPFHAYVAEALASVGSHLFIEKPLAESCRSAASFIKKIENYNQIFLLGYNLRYLTSLQKFRNFYHEGLIGRALAVRCEMGQYLPSWRPGSDYRQGVSARSELGGGVLLELSHELDYLCWLFGDINYVRATLGKLSDLDVDVDDTAYLTLEFKGQTAPILASLNLDFIRHDTTRQCTIIGETGSLRWDSIKGSVEHFTAGSMAWKELFFQIPERNQSYISEWNHIEACLEGNEKPLVTMNDGLYILKVIEAALQSSSAAGAQISIGDITT